jgi:hypothetical protein
MRRHAGCAFSSIGAGASCWLPDELGHVIAGHSEPSLEVAAEQPIDADMMFLGKSGTPPAEDLLPPASAFLSACRPGRASRQRRPALSSSQP